MIENLLVLTTQSSCLNRFCQSPNRLGQPLDVVLAKHLDVRLAQIFPNVKHLQEPKEHDDNGDDVQDSLNRPVHRDVRIHGPEDDSDGNQYEDDC